MSSQPATWHMKVWPGEDWSRTFVVEDQDLSAAAWLLEVREAPGETLIVSASTANGRIVATYSAPDTTVVMTLNDTLTSALTMPHVYQHFIKATLAGVSEYYFVGDFTVKEVPT